MKISAKGRYGLASMVVLAQTYDRGEYVTIISISEKLGISKIYLEQVFALLKRAALVISVKGAQGGYQLARTPLEINVFEILKAIELTLFEKTEKTVSELAPEIDGAMQDRVFAALDRQIEQTLSGINLYTLVQQAEKQKTEENYMFYI